MKKLDYLNGLRGLAALVVVIHHFAYVFLVYATKGVGQAQFGFEKIIYTSPLQLLVAGNFAVCIFFILSGFVLSYAFFQTGRTGLALAAATKRYFRLMPPILVSVLMSYAILTLGFNFNHQAAEISGSPWLANFWPRAVSLGEAVYYGAVGIIVGDSSPGLLNNALWTMKVEFLGSMLVFGFLAVFGKLRWRWLIYAVLVAVSWNSYYLAFVLGMALCDVSNSRWSPKVLPWPAIGLLVIGGLALGAAPIPGPTATVYSSLAWPGADRYLIFILSHIIGALMLLVAIIYSPTLKTVFSSAPLRYLGKISFALYLLHVLVLGSYASYLFVLLNRSLSYGVSLMWTGLAYVVIALIAADIFTRYVDEPAIRWAGYIQRRLLAAKSARPAMRQDKEADMISAARVRATNI